MIKIKLKKRMFQNLNSKNPAIVKSVQYRLQSKSTSCDPEQKRRGLGTWMGASPVFQFWSPNQWECLSYSCHLLCTYEKHMYLDIVRLSLNYISMSFRDLFWGKLSQYIYNMYMTVRNHQIHPKIHLLTQGYRSHKKLLYWHQKANKNAKLN